MATEQPEVAVAAAVLLLLVVTSGRYGWFRDELYFAEAGRHPAWGYADQPLLTPLVVAAAAALGHGSIVIVRLASALASAATALLTGRLAADMGGSTRARFIAAATWGVGGVSLVTGHIVDTATFDILATAGVCLCLARAATTQQSRWLVVAGAVLGLGLLDKMMVGIATACLAVSIAALGPRWMLRSRATLVAAVLAVLGAAPFLLWQAANGWPMADLARAIAGNGDEGGRIGFIPFQFLLISPALAPIWIAGLVRLWRNQAARTLRFFALAYPLMIMLLLPNGGKAYYVIGLVVPLVAAGAIATDEWVRRGASMARVRMLAIAIGLSLVIDGCIGLAVLPIRLLSPTGVLAVNPDATEEIGWPQLVGAVAGVWKQIPAASRSHAVVFTSNYGEAGAIDQFGASNGLPSAYSGHNAFAQWGPPPDTSTQVVVVGFPLDSSAAQDFVGCRQAGTVDNRSGIDNDEQGAPILLCQGTTKPWSQLWPSLIHYD